MKYQPPFDDTLGPVDAVQSNNSNPDAGYVNGNPSTGVEGSIPPAAAFEDPQREIIKVIKSSGQTADHAHLDQLAQGVSRYAAGGAFYCNDTGAANAYVLAATGTFVPPNAYFDGMEVEFVPLHSNTAASTINAYGLGVKNLLNLSGAAMSGSEVVASRLTAAVYSGAAGAFIQKPWAQASAAVTDYYAVDTGSVNAVVANFAVASSSMTAILGKILRVKLANAFTGAATININSLGVQNLKRPDGTAIKNGDGAAGEVALMVWDGTNVQLVETLPSMAVLTGGLVVFNSAGTTNWTVPSGITKIFARGWASGGGGGGCASTGAAGGGGAGGFGEGWFSVTPGQVIPITIGAAAAGGTSAGTGGGNGGTTSLGSLASCTGGIGGAGVGSGVGAGGAGGTATGWTINRTGMAGGNGTSAASGSGGCGGASPYFGSPLASVGGGGGGAASYPGQGSNGAGGSALAGGVTLAGEVQIYY